MDKIIREISEAQKQVDFYKCGQAICDDENTLSLLELAAERLLYEIALFKVKKKIKEKIIHIKHTAIDKVVQ